MLCKSILKRVHLIVMMVSGAVLLVFGIIFNKVIPSDADNLSILAGFCTGLGGSFFGIGGFRLIKNRFQSPETLKREEIQLKDERHILILRVSYTVVAIVSILIFVSMAILFLALDYMMPAFVCILAIIIDLIVFLVSHGVFWKKL